MSDVSNLDEESPFPRGTVMRGYPLDREEKAALEKALSEIERARSHPETHDAASPERSGA